MARSRRTPPPPRRRLQANPRDRVESPGQWRTTPRPVDWPARVQRVLARDVSCRWTEDDTDGQPCSSTQDLEVDHIGDPTDHRLDNLRALCHWHHAGRTARQAADARRQAPSRDRPRPSHPGLIDTEPTSPDGTATPDTPPF
jgi:hypothetical protein